MRTVIKGTKTVGEYLEVKERMEEAALDAYMEHQAACQGEWSHGDIAKVWYDNEVLCIQYTDNTTFHYQNGEWW